MSFGAIVVVVSRDSDPIPAISEEGVGGICVSGGKFKVVVEKEPAKFLNLLGCGGLAGDEVWKGFTHGDMGVSLLGGAGSCISRGRALPMCKF